MEQASSGARLADSTRTPTGRSGGLHEDGLAFAVQLRNAAPDVAAEMHRGDVFTWPAEGGANYKVIDMSQDQVVLQQMDNRKMWTVARPGVDGDSKAPSPTGGEK